MAGRSEVNEIRRCGEWLANCLKLGWRNDQLDALEKLWWKYHRLENCPICRFGGAAKAARKVDDERNG